MRPLVPIAGVLAFVAGLAACNAVLDIPEAGHLTDGDGGTSTSSSTGGPNSSTSSSGELGHCDGSHKFCGGECVTLDNPLTGCGHASCDPCDLPAATATCNSDGACAVAACKDGFKDCNSKPIDGCEVDTNNDTSNCGDCDSPCDGALTCKKGSCGCDTSIQCGLVTEGGDQAQISCNPDNRACTCFTDACDVGSACDVNDQSCD